jgi:hypothetical protein
MHELSTCFFSLVQVSNMDENSRGRGGHNYLAGVATECEAAERGVLFRPAGKWPPNIFQAAGRSMHLNWLVL